MVSNEIKYLQRFVSNSGSIALYPFCNALTMGGSTLHTPTLILGGTADTYTPIDACITAFEGSTVNIKIYNNATHAWDAPNPPRTIFALGRSIFMSYDPRATQDGIEQAWKFLIENMRL